MLEIKKVKKRRVTEETIIRINQLWNEFYEMGGIHNKTMEKSMDALLDVKEMLQKRLEQREIRRAKRK